MEITTKYDRIIKVDAGFLKLAVMEYLRFKRGFLLVCTEGINNADVSALKKTLLIEVEIKISKSDILAEFRHKTNKHDIYSGKIVHKNTIIPNEYWMCVPEELENVALEEIKKNNDKYGLFVYRKNKHLWGGYLECVKYAYKINKTIPNQEIFEKIYKRLTNENITFRQKQYDLYKPL